MLTRIDHKTCGVNRAFAIAMIIGFLPFPVATVPFGCSALYATGSEDDRESRVLKKQRMEIMKRSVQAVHMTVGIGRKAVRATVSEPLQRWDNPTGVTIPDATFFVWMIGRRPVAAAQVFKLDDRPTWSQEFSSLTTKPVMALDRERRFWSPVTSGIQWLDAPAAEPPADSERLRLLQMRNLSRDYQAANKTDTDSPNQLRVLPTPLLRYEDEDSGVVDGALFSFALGTDPEVLCLIESRNTTGNPMWKIAFAPMTIFACEVKHRGRAVWSCPLRLPPHKIDSTFMYHEFAAEIAPTFK